MSGECVCLVAIIICITGIHPLETYRILRPTMILLVRFSFLRSFIFIQLSRINIYCWKFIYMHIMTHRITPYSVQSTHHYIHFPLISACTSFHEPQLCILALLVGALFTSIPIIWLNSLLLLVPASFISIASHTFIDSLMDRHYVENVFVIVHKRTKKSLHSPQPTEIAHVFPSVSYFRWSFHSPYPVNSLEWKLDQQRHWHSLKSYNWTILVKGRTELKSIGFCDRFICEFAQKRRICSHNSLQRT